jgi:broad specificity phosphatase PhoE
MTRILLIRHGHTQLLGKVLYGRIAGVHLSDQGKDEIDRLANALPRRYHIDEIVSSPMERAWETAQRIAQALEQEVTIDEDLQEINFGEWMGSSFGQLREDEQWKLYNRCRSLNRAPGGEFMLEAQLRGWQAVQRAVKRHAGESEPTIAIVSHGDVVRGLLMLFLGMPLDNIHRIEVSTASVSEVILGTAYPQVITINQTL